MKLAVKKLNGLGGFHYMLQPFALNEFQEYAYHKMGHVIIEVEEAQGARLLTQAGNALKHQVEIAMLTERAERGVPRGGAGDPR